MNFAGPVLPRRGGGGGGGGGVTLPSQLLGLYTTVGAALTALGSGSVRDKAEVYNDTSGAVFCKLIKVSASNSVAYYVDWRVFKAGMATIGTNSSDDIEYLAGSSGVAAGSSGGLEFSGASTLRVQFNFMGLWSQKAHGIHAISEHTASTPDALAHFAVGLQNSLGFFIGGGIQNDGTNWLSKGVSGTLSSPVFTGTVSYGASPPSPLYHEGHQSWRGGTGQSYQIGYARSDSLDPNGGLVSGAGTSSANTATDASVCVTYRPDASGLVSTLLETVIAAKGLT